MIDGNEIWEALFAIMEGNVPDEMTEVVCEELASRLATPPPASVDALGEVGRVARVMVEVQGMAWNELDGGDHGYWESLAIAALSAMSPAWQDIATAPRDGSEILLWPAIRRPVERKVPCAVGRWSKYPELECWDDLAVGHHNGFWKPTHWQPLPTPPETRHD